MKIWGLIAALILLLLPGIAAAQLEPPVTFDGVAQPVQNFGPTGQLTGGQGTGGTPIDWAHTYQSLANQWDGPIRQSALGVAGHIIGAQGQMLTLLMTLAVIIFGITTAAGRMDVATFVLWLSRFGLVSIALLGAGNYDKIANFAMVEIPDWIAQVTNGGATGAAQFDVVAQHLYQQKAAVLQLTPGIWWVGARVELAFLMACAITVLSFQFICFEIANSFMALLIATAPALIILELFAATRQVARNLLSAGLTIAIILLLISVVLGFVMQIDQNLVTVGAGDVDERLAALTSSLVALTWGFAMTLAVPILGVMLGGGVMVAFAPIGGSIGRGVRNMGSGAMNMMRR